ncbi:MAG: calcium-binding protein, partial [Spirulina sp.]
AIATFTTPLSDLAQTTVGTDNNDTLNGLQEVITAQISVTGINAAGDSITAVDNATVTVDARDTIAGGLGDDIIFGGGADDVLRGDRNSRKSGGKIGGDDIIHGGAGNDRIGGKAGNDTLFGDEGDDQIWGDDGDDIIRGGSGNDTLTGDDFSGGTGRDTFVLAIAEGTDTIVDFKQGEDIIGLTGNLTYGQLDITRQSDRTEIKFGQETLAILEGVTSTLTEDDFMKMT